MKSHRILPAALLLCTFAACGPTPTGSDPQAHPTGASFDGGFVIGSGNMASEGAEGTATSTEDSDTGTASGGEEDTGRGGFVIGSGN